MEVHGVDYLSWRQLLRRVRTLRRYRVDHFGLPKVLTGDALLALAHETLVERSCTYIDSLLQVGPEYQIPVEDYWETHTDPETGNILVNGAEDDYWNIDFFVGNDDEEIDESRTDGILEPVGLSVESIAAEVIARRCAEIGWPTRRP